MTQLVELINAERRRTEEQYEHLVARFEERLEMFDEMAEKARRLEEAEVDLMESKSDTSAPEEAATKRGSASQETAGDRKAKILVALREADPEQLRSKDLQKVVGLTSASGVRPLLEELLSERKIVKTGQRAGTRYGIAEESPAAPALGDETSADDGAVISFLETQKQPHSIPLIAMKTKLPSTRVVAALNRLKNARRVHVVRIGAGNAFEAVGK